MSGQNEVYMNMQEEEEQSESADEYVYNGNHAHPHPHPHPHSHPPPSHPHPHHHPALHARHGMHPHNHPHPHPHPAIHHPPQHGHPPHPPMPFYDYGPPPPPGHPGIFDPYFHPPPGIYNEVDSQPQPQPQLQHQHQHQHQQHQQQQQNEVLNQPVQVQGDEDVDVHAYAIEYPPPVGHDEHNISREDDLQQQQQQTQTQTHEMHHPMQEQHPPINLNVNVNVNVNTAEDPLHHNQQQQHHPHPHPYFMPPPPPLPPPQGQGQHHNQANLNVNAHPISSPGRALPEGLIPVPIPVSVPPLPLYEQMPPPGPHPPPPPLPLPLQPPHTPLVQVHNRPLPLSLPLPLPLPHEPNFEGLPLPISRKKVSSIEAWNSKFDQLSQFQLTHGHVDVPQTYKTNKSLGKWVGKQREHYKIFCKNRTVSAEDEHEHAHEQRKSCPLTEERVQRLVSLGFRWVMGKGQYGKYHGIFDGSCTMKERWEEKFALLAQFKEVYGHLDVTTVLSASVGGKSSTSASAAITTDITIASATATATATVTAAVQIPGISFGHDKDETGMATIAAIDSCVEADGGTNNAGQDDQGEAPLPLHEQNELSAPQEQNIGHVNNEVDIFGNLTGDIGGGSNKSPEFSQMNDEQIKSLSRWIKFQRQKYNDVQNQKVVAGQELEDRFRRLVNLGLDLAQQTNISNAPSGSADQFSTDIEHENNVWEVRFLELCEYVKTHGDAKVVTTNSRNYPHLLRWVQAQREFYRTSMMQRRSDVEDMTSEKRKTKCSMSRPNPLTSDRIDRLEKIGFHFQPLENRFEERVEQLSEFIRKRGHMKVRYSDSRQLYEWINRQRAFFRDFMEGKGGDDTQRPHQMTLERVTRLGKINFVWDYRFEDIKSECVKAAVESAENWNKGKKLLKAFEGTQEAQLDTYDTTSDRPAQPDTTIAATTIAANSDSLFGEQSREEFGVVDSIETEEQRQILDFYYHPRPKHNLMIFNQSDRVEHVENMLDPGKKTNIEIEKDDSNIQSPSKVNTHGHKKGSKPELWQKHFQQLRDFFLTNGHCRVPGRFTSNPKLGVWVKLQREDYRRMREQKPSPMCQYRIIQLEKLRFEWSVFNMEERRNSWNIRFDELKVFKEKNGHCNVPQKSGTLGKWVSKQRDNFRNKSPKLTQERIDKLEALGFKFFVGKGKSSRSWDAFYDAAKVFRDRYGHTHIPLCYPNDPKLGRWAYQQRLNYFKRKNGQGSNDVTKKRLARLEKIGFAFHVKGKGATKRAKKHILKVDISNGRCTKRTKIDNSEAFSGDLNTKHDKEDGIQNITENSTEKTLEHVLEYLGTGELPVEM